MRKSYGAWNHEATNGEWIDPAEELRAMPLTWGLPPEPLPKPFTVVTITVHPYTCTYRETG